MQGRLSPRIDGKIQAYPAKTWQKEFEIAQEIGYSAIEWIVEEPMAENSLMTESGLSEIAKIIEKTNVKVDYICADIFMQQPLIRMNSKNKESNKHYLSQILINANKIGAIGVEIPFVDNSSIKNDEEKEELIEVMQDAFKLANDLNLKISLETDLAPLEFKKLLDEINLEFVQANYDIGNSASLGYDCLEEMQAYGNRILNVHIKDRVLGGSTVELGTGNANISLVLEKLNSINYSGGITMQAARGKDDIETAKRHLNYILDVLKKF
ncbi:MAG: sugar phosphate isomerase/epimerase family protein [Candidatus Nanopelagicales bacterium]